VPQLSFCRVPESILVCFAFLLIRSTSTDPRLYYGCFTLISGSCWLLLLCIIYGERNHYLIRVLDSPLARWTGRRSYGLYLYHYPIFVAFESLRIPKNGANFVLVSLLRFAVSFSIAAFSYRFVEMPFFKKEGAAARASIFVVMRSELTAASEIVLVLVLDFLPSYVFSACP